MSCARTLAFVRIANAADPHTTTRISWFFMPRPPYNFVVIRLARATALFLVAPFLTFASTLAPQHIHEAGPDHDHAITHSHFAPHDVSLHHTETTEIEHDDAEHVVWLDSAMLHQSIHKATHVPPALPVCYETVPGTNQWSVFRFDNPARAHGPPKSSSCLRGPPPLV
jgi:hypothetical protein